MEKFFVLVSVLVMSSAAYAMPNVGDDAVYTVSATESGQTVNGTMEFKLMSQDASTGNWGEQVTTVINGQSNVQTQSMTSQQLVTDAQAQTILANCAAVGGTPANITVPAGAFSTCAIPSSSNDGTGTVWVADVAFGVVQEDVTNPTSGEHVVLQLQSQSAGQ
jgi:hypothetical protein